MAWASSPPPQLSPGASGFPNRGRRPLAMRSGDLNAAGNGEPPRLPLFPAGVSFSLPRIRFWPFLSNPTAHVRRYPFAGDYAKEPLGFQKIEPAVPSALR